MQAGMVLWVVGMLTLLGSCGSDEKKILDNREGMKSGTRLKLRWYDFDGEKLPAGLFDSERNEACTPTLWPDGRRYCTPNFEPPRAPIFRDASCTVQIARISTPACEAPPENALFAQEEKTCAYASPFRPYFDKLVRGSRILLTEHYFNFGADCVRVDGSGTYYELGDELSASGLVELSTEKPEGEGDLQLIYASSADGARILLHGFDRALEAACTLRPSHDDQALRCVPEALFTREYSDPTCQQAKVAFVSHCAPTAFALTDEACGADLTLHRVSAQTSAGPAYAKRGETCEETTPLEGFTYYSVGQEVATQSVPRAPFDKDGPRIQRFRFSDDDVRFANNDLFDTTHEDECSPITLADGTIRCLPSPSYLDSRFTDAACQTPITLKYQFAQCGDLRIYPLIHLASNDCPLTRQIFKVGDRYTGELYRYIAGVCTRVDQSDPGTYYSVGSDVPVTSFAQGTLVTEP